jgi:prepilin-type N-terminal cleavage/methylation domain-containing protein/prepilin-type processing-associated H-X9-DG protein
MAKDRRKTRRGFTLMEVLLVLALMAAIAAMAWPALRNPFAGHRLRAAADQDIKVSPPNGNAGGDTIYRLRQGIERFLITDINNPASSAVATSSIFVMYDNVSQFAQQFNHVPGGSNVLYMDGHVEFIKYPGPPPLNKKMSAIMRMFDQRRPGP